MALGEGFMVSYFSLHQTMPSITRFMPRGRYPSFPCPWCEKKVDPVSNSQVTCGDMSCSEKHRIARAQARRRKRAKSA